MSVFLVGKTHVLYLIESMRHFARDRQSAKFYWTDHAGRHHDADVHDTKQLASLANTLMTANVESFRANYPKADADTLRTQEITANELMFRRWAKVDPVQVIKSCDCLIYQSNEFDGWHASDAKAILEALISVATKHLKGYDGAQWGSPEPHTYVAWF